MGRFTLLSAIPLLIVPVAVYNLYVLGLGGAAGLTAPLFDLRATAAGSWPVSVADLLLALGVVTLFVELVKATASRHMAIVNHALTMVLFVACLVEMLLLPAFANSTFFLITLMVLLDVLAGFIVTLAGAPQA